MSPNNEVVCIPIDSQALADILDQHSTDWEEDLYFLESYASSQGFTIDVSEVERLMTKRYEN
jgi:hypothetical protein